jgi:hypothetical protein
MNGKNNDVLDNRLYICGFSLRPEALGILENNFVNNKPFVLLHNQHGILVDNAGQVSCINCSDIIVRNLTIFNVRVGLNLEETSNSFFENNTISNCYQGIAGTCDHCKFFNNNVNHSQDSGVYIRGDHNEFKFNTFYNNSYLGFSADGIQDVQYNSFSNSMYGVFANQGIFAHNIVQQYFLVIETTGFITLNYNTITNCDIGVWVYYFVTIISHNNFFNNSLDATLTNVLFIRWHGNYWKRSVFRPKLIIGFFGIGYLMIPWVNIDWHPATEPNDIEHYI